MTQAKIAPSNLPRQNSLSDYEATDFQSVRPKAPHAENKKVAEPSL
jgi:hypothetical protein